MRDPGPLRRKTQLRRTGPPKRRSRLRTVSLSKLDPQAQQARLEARQRVFQRDGGCLLAGRPGIPQCIGPMTPHHLRKSGQGGPYNELNLVTLCAGHNVWVEASDAVPYVREWGLVKRRGDTYEEIWGRLAAAGLVSYTWTGAPVRGPA